MQENTDGLNPAQKEAVETVQGPLLVMAGAGSGKTRVVTFRIVKMLELGIPSSEILALTFTNKAAKVMKERIYARTDVYPLICTFHGLGAKMLRESIDRLGYLSDFNIYDEEDAGKTLQSCLDEAGIKGGKGQVRTFRSLISEHKNSLIDPENVSPNLFPKNSELSDFPKIYRRYQELLKAANAVDFDDLLYLPVKLLKQFPDEHQKYLDRWHYILVDEYQDTNAAQYELVKLLSGDQKNVCVVGDPDQSIYSWRGADVGNILRFEKDFPNTKVVTLDQNYRSVNTILESANALIGHNKQRSPKNLWSQLGAGEKIKLFVAENEKTEASFIADTVLHYHKTKGIPYHQIAVFYRTNSQSRPFEDSFLLNRIPYHLIGALSFYQRKEIKDVLAFLRLLISPEDFAAFSRTINIPKRGIGDATLDKLRFGALEENLSILEYLQKLLDGTAGSEVRLNKKQKSGLEEYLSIIAGLKQHFESSPLSLLVEHCISSTGYLQYLKEDPLTFDERKENLNALIAKSVEWESESSGNILRDFIEEMTLKSTLDDAEEPDRVSLMTLHNGKGLEFTLVIMAGMEEDLLPHINSKTSPAELEEERRICYVGMTRAMQLLIFTRAKFRYVWGQARDLYPSRFLKEVPAENIEKIYSMNRPSGVYLEKRPKISVDDLFLDAPDQPFAEEEASFLQGDAVLHKDFGVGVIQSSYQSSMGLAYKVLFAKDQKERSLVAHLAKLKKL